MSAPGSSEERRSFGDRRPETRYVVRPSAYVVARDPTAAVAVVRTPMGLFLPGGGIEPGESPAQAGVREAMEECGLAVTVQDVLGVADEHLHPSHGPPIVKVSHFLRVSITGVATGAGEADHTLVWLAQGTAEAELSYGGHRWAIGLDPRQHEQGG